MDKSGWRSRARFVAYLQFAFLGLSLIVATFLGILLYDATFPNNQTGLSRQFNQITLAQQVEHYLTAIRREVLDQFKGKFYEQRFSRYFTVEIPIYLWWIAFVALVAETGIQWWLASKLMKATEIGTAPSKALSNAISWRNVTAGFILLEMLVWGICLYVAVISTTLQLHLACLVLLIAIMFDLGLKIIFFPIIWKFINELEMYSPVYTI